MSDLIIVKAEHISSYSGGGGCVAVSAVVCAEEA